MRQIMTVTSNEMIVAGYAMTRANNSLFGAMQLTKCVQLLTALKNGVVHGFFRKVDGSIREFWGTTNPSLAAHKTVNSVGYAPKLRHGQIAFIDCETGKWRSMRIGSFIGFAE